MCFLPLEDIEAKHFQTVHNLPHFREFQESRDVILSKNRKELIEKAKKSGAQLIIFPELSLLGYPPQDLLLRKKFSFYPFR